MYCRDCGEKLTLRFLEKEGLVPYCTQCDKFKFPFFPVAVSMTVVNRAEDKILLAKHTGDEEYKLLAGYIKKGESAEKAIPRELKEETNLTAIKFIVTAEEGETKLNEELEETRWCTPDEARSLIKPQSTAEYFLLGALNELGKKK